MSRGHSEGLTKKQRFWLGHLAACEKSGRRLCDYGSIHGLDRHQLYSWKTRLGQRGLLGGPAAGPARAAKGQVRRTGGHGRTHGLGEGKVPVRFAAVHLAGDGYPGSLLRIRFPNGIILETTETGSGSMVRDLLSSLAGLP